MNNLEVTPARQSEYDRIQREVANDIAEHQLNVEYGLHRREYIEQRIGELTVSRQRIMDSIDTEILALQNELKGLDERA